MLLSSVSGVFDSVVLRSAEMLEERFKLPTFLHFCSLTNSAIIVN